MINFLVLDIISLKTTHIFSFANFFFSLQTTNYLMNMANEQEEPSIPSLEIPSDGKVLLPHIVDSLAKTKPHQIHAEYPVSSLSYDDGYRQITYSDLANAVNGVAWWLHKTLGPGKFEKLAYIGPNDLRYPVLVLGAVKAGYVVSSLLSRCRLL